MSSEWGYQERMRRWVRSKEPTEGWWPWGILPLLAFLIVALVAFFYVAPSRVEAQVESRAKAQLAEAGYPWVNVEADGQEVHLSGETPAGFTTDRLTEKVKAVAKGTDCGTFVGQLGCPTHAYASFTAAKAVVPAVPVARVHPFRFVAEGNSVELTGEVPSKKEMNRLVSTAKKRFDKVDHKLTVTGERATPDYAKAYRRSLQVLPMLKSGRSTWNDDLTITGAVSQKNDGPAKQKFRLSKGAPPLGGITLKTEDVVASCEAKFRKLFEGSTIRFATGSATIAKSSNPLLESLASTAKSCPGNLVVEGHTDNVGKAQSNQQLSQNRAEAVRSALGNLGVDASRMKSRGYGQERPIAPNTTPAGKAKNRRIEIHIER